MRIKVKDTVYSSWAATSQLLSTLKGMTIDFKNELPGEPKDPVLEIEYEQGQFRLRYDFFREETEAEYQKRSEEELASIREKYALGEVTCLENVLDADVRVRGSEDPAIASANLSVAIQNCANAGIDLPFLRSKEEDPPEIAQVVEVSANFSKLHVQRTCYLLQRLHDRVPPPTVHFVPEPNQTILLSWYGRVTLLQSGPWVRYSVTENSRVRNVEIPYSAFGEVEINTLIETIKKSASP